MGKIQGLKCIECGSTKLWSTGLTVTRKGKKERCKCQECGRSFYVGDAKKEQSPKVQFAKRSHRKKAS